MQGTTQVHTQKRNCTLVCFSAFEAIPSRVCWEPNLLILSLVNVLITEIKSHTEIFKLYKIQPKTKKGSDYNYHCTRYHVHLRQMAFLHKMITDNTSKRTQKPYNANIARATNFTSVGCVHYNNIYMYHALCLCLSLSLSLSLTC